MTTSLRRFGAIALVASVLLSSWGQLSMKVGMQELNHTLAAGATFLDPASMSSPLIWTGIGLMSYALSLCSWLMVLVRFPLSFAYPLLSLSYVCVYLGATYWPRLGEAATSSRSLGIVLILSGVALVYSGRSRKNTETEAR